MKRTLAAALTAALFDDSTDRLKDKALDDAYVRADSADL